MSKFIVQRLLLFRRKCFIKPFALNFCTTKVYKANDSKYIISGSPLDKIVGLTVPEYVFSDLSKYGSLPAFSCGITGRSYTYQQIYGMSHSFAAALKQNDLKKGDVVGIMLPNLPEYPVIELGVWLAGGIVTPISSSLTLDEVVRQCQIADAKIVVTMAVFLPLIKATQSKIPAIKSIINVGKDPVDGAHSFFEMIQVNPKGVEFQKGSDIDTENDIAMLPFSSGTTGPPKGVMLTHCSICSNVEQYRQPGAYSGKDNERFIAILPFYHCYGSGSLIFAAIKLGSQVKSLPRFDPQAFTELIRSYKPTTLHVVTPILQFMFQSPEFKKAEFASVETIICGAAPAGKSLIMGLLKKADKEIFFQEGYGMTEMTTLSHITRVKTKNKKIGSIGCILDGTKCKVVDPNTGESLPNNVPGELWVQGPQVMKGYFKNEEATKETITSDGWLKTADIVIYDEDNCFYIVDRMKELIKVKGLQVSPSELEDLLRTSTEIVDVAVVGVPHERFGEAPRAFIVRKSEKLTDARVHDFLERKIAPHKKLAGGVEFVDSIPRAPSGKILRRVILDHYQKSGGKS